MSLQRPSRYLRHLEAFHKLSERVAHDANNLLSGILGYCDLALMDLSIRSVRNPLEEISSAGKRIASLIRMQSAFSDSYHYQPETFGLNEAILDIEEFLQRILGEAIELRIVRLPGLWMVKADPAKMKQALITLAVDMKSTMLEGGTLQISTKNQVEDGTSLPDGRIVPGSYVRITVISSGKIAPDEAREFLADFASSSPRAAWINGESVLPNVCDFVKLANGRLAVEAWSEQEIIVSISLPAIPAEPESRQSGNSPRQTAES